MNICQGISLVVAMCCFQALLIYHFSCPSSGVVSTMKVPSPQSRSVEPAKRESTDKKSGQDHACVLTGRWMYLRILLPFLYRELRKKTGGVVDRVIFAMIGYTEEA